MDRSKLQAMLIEEESLKLFPYRDSRGLLTIGIGRNLDGVGITESEAIYLNNNDITRAEMQLDEHLPWWRGLDEVRQLVMADLCFNMGIGNQHHGLLSFVNTLQYIRAGSWEEASIGLLNSKWAKDVGPRRSSRLAGMMRVGVLIRLL